MFAILAFVAGAGALMWSAGADLAESLPRYEKQLVGLQHDAALWLRDHGMRRAAASVSALDATQPLQGLVASSLLGMSGILQTMVLVLIITAFMQLEAATYRRKLAIVFGSHRPMRKTMHALKDVNRYLFIKFLMSAMNGILLGLWCALWGVSSPLLWGMVAFTLNFIPVIGSTVAAIPPIVLTLETHGPGPAAGDASGYFVVNSIIENVLETRLMGRAVGLSPLVVLLALMVWGFVLGPVGALLSVPLTMAVKVVFQHSDDLKWIATLLGNPIDLDLNVEGVPTSPLTQPGNS